MTEEALTTRGTHNWNVLKEALEHPENICILEIRRGRFMIVEPSAYYDPYVSMGRTKH